MKVTLSATLFKTKHFGKDDNFLLFEGRNLIVVRKVVRNDFNIFFIVGTVGNLADALCTLNNASIISEQDYLALDSEYDFY